LVDFTLHGVWPNRITNSPMHLVLTKEHPNDVEVKIVSDEVKNPESGGDR
jgi:hypothetical protein